MNQSSKVTIDYQSDAIGFNEARLAQSNVESPLRESDTSLEFTDVTGKSSCNSFFYSVVKKLFRSAYKFFSYVSSYFTSYFSQDSFRDITSNITTPIQINVTSDTPDRLITRAAVAVVEERKENCKTIYEYDLHYSEYVEFYQKQEDFLKNYLEYLSDAIHYLKTEVQNFYFKNSESSKSRSATRRAISNSPIFDLIKEINEILDSLKEIPELMPVVTKIKEVLFNNKKSDDIIVLFSARALATMIKGQLDYFKMRQASNQVLKKEAEVLSDGHLEFIVGFDPQASYVTKTEFTGNMIPPEKLPKSEELPKIKKTAEHARLSLLNYMRIFRKEIEEDVTLVNQEIERLQNLRKTRAEDAIKKHHEAYRNSPFRFKI